jgi:chromate transporter
MGAALARGLPRSAAWAFFTLPVAGAPALSFFWTCFKAGFVVFGSGLAIIPLLEHEVVATHGWITHAQFMDGLVIGQVTPGPVLITTTFIGFLLGGFPGACLATVGTFLPGFIIVLGILPRVWDRLAGTPWVAGFTRWAIPAVIGGILGVTIRLGRVAFLGGYAPWPLYAVFGLGLFAAFSRKIPAWLLIPAGGVGMYVFNALSQIYFF